MRYLRYLVFIAGALSLLPVRLLLAQTPPPAKTPVTSNQPEHPEQGPVLTGEQVTLPLVVVKGYPFVQGAINGKAGDLMFDTGLSFSLSVNTHAITLQSGTTIGHGVTDSGQKLTFCSSQL